jgi:general secretion pathway protein G
MEAAASGLPKIAAGRPILLFVLAGMLVISGGMLVMEASRAFNQEGTPKRVLRTYDSLRNIRIALELFRRHCGRYPTTDEGLKSLVRNPGATGWRGPYVQEMRPDLWKRPFYYRVAETNVVLYSGGPDRKPGTADDIRPEPVDKETIDRHDFPEGTPNPYAPRAPQINIIYEDPEG